MNTEWYGLMKVLNIEHLDVDGTLLWKQSNVRNLLHAQGEKFILDAMFSGDATIPTNYYLGMDNRSSLARGDTLATVSASEPTGSFGYVRSTVPSSGSFVVTEVDEIVYEAKSPILSFSATGGNWGPVSNLFLTNVLNFSGVLISSVLLSSPITVTDGQTINIRISLGLRDCPV